VFIWGVRTASGVTAVQIAQHVAGRQQIVRHVGSAHSDAELGVLMERAEELLGDPGQGSFDLGVEPQRPVVPRSGAAGQPALLPPAPRMSRSAWNLVTVPGVSAMRLPPSP
jgi:hypothetical protein